MIRKSEHRSIVFGVLALVTGCAGNVGNMLTELEHHDAAVELVDMPFHSQVTDQCGPAALATVLNSTDVPVSPEALKSRVYIPDREGSLQLELLGATRHYGRIPYVIDTDIGDLLAELHSGRPVLVLQNLGPKLAPVWHYAVVVGYLPSERKFVLRSGDRKRMLMNARSFLRTWQRANHWAFVALRPGDLPAVAAADSYLRATAAFESVDDAGSAVPAYRAATEEWPRYELAWLGLGNALYSIRELASARSAYQKVLELEPEHLIAMNNLSQVHAELGCREEALALLHSALSIAAPDDPLHRHLNLTLQEVQQKSAISGCP